MLERIYSRRAVIRSVGAVGFAAAASALPKCDTAGQAHTDDPSTILAPGATPTPQFPDILPADPALTPIVEATPVVPRPEVIDRYAVPFVFKRGDPDKPYLYLTVDDCWERNLVTEMLTRAEANDAHLTFFPVAAVVKQSPDFWKDVLSRGHGISNHTINHPNVTKLSYAEKETQILGAKKILEDTLQIDVPIFRPPFGAMDRDVEKICRDNGLKIALWTIMSQGYAMGAHNKDRSAADIAASSEISGIVNGGIICMHAINPDINGVGSVIQRAKDAGLKPITMQQGLI